MAKTKGPAKVNKSAFIRKLPEEMSAEEVVQKAAEAGLTVTKAYVYTIRSTSKRSAKARADGSVVGRRRGRPPGVAGAAGPVELERAFAKLAVELGLAKAQGILDRLRSRIHNLL
jgi:hypothetical protein